MPENLQMPIPAQTWAWEVQTAGGDRRGPEEGHVSLKLFFHSVFIYSVSKHPLSTHEVPGAILDPGNTALEETDKALALLDPTVSHEEMVTTDK